MKAVAEVLGVSHSNLHDRLKGTTKPPRRHHKAQAAAVVPLVAAQPTYGYRRVTAVLNRPLRAEGLAPVNHKRVYRITRAHRRLLARPYMERPDLAHDGKFVTRPSNLRWGSAGFEFTCWNGEVVRGPSSSTPMTGRSWLGAPWQ